MYDAVKVATPLTSNVVAVELVVADTNVGPPSKLRVDVLPSVIVSVSVNPVRVTLPSFLTPIV